jgi:site-specific DNA recombinase
MHRRRYLLSGLLVCGRCGGGYTIVGPNRYGCAARRSKGTCSNAVSIGREEIESRVLDGLKDRMMAPELIAAFVDEFNTEIRRLAGDLEAEHAAVQRALAEADRKIAGILKAIEDGAYHPSLKERLTLLEQDKASAAARLAAAQSKPVLRLHPNLPALYRKKVQRLAVALREPDIALQAGEIIRSLIDRIVLTPSDGGLEVELFGDLAAILAYAADEQLQTPRGLPEMRLSVVAGAPNSLDLLLSTSIDTNASQLDPRASDS